MAFDEAQEAAAAAAETGEHKATYAARAHSPGGGETKQRKEFDRSLVIGKPGSYMQDGGPAEHKELINAMFELKSFNDNNPIHMRLPEKRWITRHGKEHGRLVEAVKKHHQALLDSKDKNVKRESVKRGGEWFGRNRRFVRKDANQPWLELGSAKDLLEGKPQVNRAGSMSSATIDNSPREAWWKGGRRSRRRHRKRQRKTRRRRHKRRTRKRRRKHKKHKRRRRTRR